MVPSFCREIIEVYLLQLKVDLGLNIRLYKAIFIHRKKDLKL